MAIINIYSKRQRKLRGEVPDVYIYDEIPPTLRAQITYILSDSLGSEHEYTQDYCRVRQGYEFIVETLCREYGLFYIYRTGTSKRWYIDELYGFIHSEPNLDKVLDAVELSFRYLNKFGRDFRHRGKHGCSKIVDNAIAELNGRFKENGVGYLFENNEIFRVDSQLIHTEAVKPALNLLNSKEFSGAQQEYLKAYEHYRHGNQKEALNEALKAFESTIKTICTKHRWSFNQSDTSKKLINICFQNGLIPNFWQNQMAGLRSLLEGGVPTGRNKLSGHGQGSTPTLVPDHIVSYVLHMTAAAIVFLVKSSDEIK